MKYIYNHDCRQCRELRRDAKQDHIVLISDEQNHFKLKCKFGHRITVLYSDEKFNMLFASGIDSIQHGNLRAAVANLASSYERLLEYSIKIISLKNRVDAKLYSEVWKNIKNQSERQIGAFTALFSFYLKDPAPIYSDQNIKFRNSVIHKGVYPTYDEVASFAVTTFEIMTKILYSLHQKCPAAVNKHNKEGLEQLNSLRRSQDKLSVIRIGSPLDVDYSDRLPSPVSLKRLLGNWKDTFANLKV